MTDKDQFSALFRQVQPKFSRLCVRVLSESDLTMPQFALLSQLVDAGTIPMTEASEKLYITKPAITNLVDRLEKNKCLKRLPHPDDRRIHLLQILPKGEKIVRDMQAAILQALLKTLDQLSASEREVIQRFYTNLSKSMDEILTHENDKS